MSYCVSQFPENLVRSFICIPLPDKQKNQLAEWISANRHQNDIFRWVNYDNVHITLKFCGERPLEIIEILSKKLSLMQKTGSFLLSIQGVGVFPNIRKPKILWVGLNGETDRLKKLAKQVSMIADSVGAEYDNKPYLPHITVARRPFGDSLNETEITRITEMKIDIEPWIVSEVILMKSILQPSRAKYYPIKCYEI